MVPKYETPGFLIGAVKRMMYPMIATEEEASMNGERLRVFSAATATITVRIVATA